MFLNLKYPKNAPFIIGQIISVPVFCRAINSFEEALKNISLSERKSFNNDIYENIIVEADSIGFYYKMDFSSAHGEYANYSERSATYNVVCTKVWRTKEINKLLAIT